MIEMYWSRDNTTWYCASKSSKLFAGGTSICSIAAAVADPQIYRMLHRRHPMILRRRRARYDPPAARSPNSSFVTVAAGRPKPARYDPPGLGRPKPPRHDPPGRGRPTKTRSAQRQRELSPKAHSRREAFWTIFLTPRTEIGNRVTALSHPQQRRGAEFAVFPQQRRGASRGVSRGVTRCGGM